MLINKAKSALEKEFRVFSDYRIRYLLQSLYYRCNTCKKNLIDIVFFDNNICDNCRYESNYLKETIYSLITNIMRIERYELEGLIKNEMEFRTLLALLKGLCDFGFRIPLIAPYRLSWELTYRCNLNCMHCYTESPRFTDELNYNESKKLVKEIADLGFQVVGLTGGEPLLKEDIDLIIKELVDYNIAVTIDTNGTLLNESLAKKFYRSEIKSLLISLDSSKEEVHDNFRQTPGSYKKALEGIKIAVKVGLPVYINTVISRMNMDHIGELINLAESLGVTGISFITFVPVGRGDNNRDVLDIPPQEFSQVNKIIREKQRSSPIHVLYGKLPGELLTEVDKLTEEDYKIFLLTGGDQDGRFQLNITPDGYVQPSCYLRINLGNVKVSSLSNIWNKSDVLNMIRDRDKLRGVCKDCIFKYVCGGSRARAYATFGDILGDDPLCPLTNKK